MCNCTPSRANPRHPTPHSPTLHSSSDDHLGGLTPVLGSPDDYGEGGAAAMQGYGLSVPYAGPERDLGEGDTFGEISFFTEIPQMETVRWVVAEC